MKELNLDDLRQFVKLDLSRLDIESRDQQSWMLEYSQVYAQAIKLRKEAQKKLDKATANKKKAILNNWKAYFERYPLADAYLMVYVNSDENILRLRQEVIEAEDMENRLKGIIKTLDQRKFSIADLIELYKQNYWAKPKADPEAFEYISKRQPQKAEEMFRDPVATKEKMKKLIKKEGERDGNTG